MPLLDDYSCFLQPHNSLAFEFDSILSDLQCSKVNRVLSELIRPVFNVH